MSDLQREPLPPIANHHCIFMDCENVCELDLQIIVGKPVRVILFVGKNQSKLPLSLFLLSQNHPGKIHVIQSLKTGKNALDFILSCELGKATVRITDRHYYIISKDGGYDAVISHLKSGGSKVARFASIRDIPLLKPPVEIKDAVAKTPHKRFELLVTQLKDSSQSRPKKRKGLEGVIRSTSGNSLNAQQIVDWIDRLVKANILKIHEGGKITYTVGSIKEQVAKKGAA